jgi:hypothetical protein
MGIRKVDKQKHVRFFDNEKAAIEFGFNGMEDNYLLVMLVDNIGQSIKIINEKMQAPVWKLEKSPIAV